MGRELIFKDYKLIVVDKKLVYYEGSNTSIVVVPEGITVIKQAVFCYCRAKAIILPNSLTEIEDSAFAHCEDLKRITIPAHVHTIGEKVFHECNNLEAVYIGKSVRTINFYQIAKQKNFKQFLIDPANPYYKIVDDVVLSKDGKSLVYFPLKREGDFSIPSHIEEIGSHAFYCSSLSHLFLTNSIKKLGDCCFAYMKNLRRVSICSADGEFQPSAFDVCLPESLTEIPKRCFESCDITSVQIPNAVKKIRDGAFSSSSISRIVFPDALREIEANAFGCTNLRKVKLPDHLSTIGQTAFNCSELEEVILPSHLRSISGNAFSECLNLKKMNFRSENPNFVINDLVIFSRDKSTLVAYCRPKEQTYSVPATVKRIADDAFSYTQIKDVLLPKGLLSIGDYAFYGSNLKSINLPEGFQHLGNDALSSTQISNGVYFPESLVNASLLQDTFPIIGPDDAKSVKYLRLLKKFKDKGCAVSCKALDRQEKVNKLNELMFKENLNNALTKRGITYVFDKRTQKKRICGDPSLQIPVNLKPAFFKVRPYVDPKKFDRQIQRICRHALGRCLVLKLRGL